jgi:competence protein ComEA
MLKKIFVPLIILFLLSGCTAAGQEVVLSDMSKEALTEQTDSASFMSQETPATDTSEDESATAKTLAVYVCGSVVSPGVYELDEGSRIVDALEAAGGFADDADRTYVNLAAVLVDGMKLQITTAEEEAPRDRTEGFESYDGDMMAASSQGGSTLININTATRDELTTLSGIGDATAEKIIRYREDNGGFKKIEDIMKISGIKEKLFSKIKDDITV